MTTVTTVTAMTANTANNMSIQLRDFQIRFTSGQLINEPIENISELDYIIRNYGRSIIAKISFYFHNSVKGLHSIILRNTETNDRFVIEFCGYYNSPMGERYKLGRQDKIDSFTSVMNCLNSSQILQSELIPFIITPFRT